MHGEQVPSVEDVEVLLKGTKGRKIWGLMLTYEIMGNVLSPTKAEWPPNLSHKLTYLGDNWGGKDPKGRNQ